MARRRRRVAGAVLIAVLFVLGWHGLTGIEGPEEGVPPAPGPARGPVEGEEGAEAARPGRRGATSPPEEDVPEASTKDAVSSSEVGGNAPDLDADSARSLLLAVRRTAEDGFLGEAWTLLGRLRAGDRGGAWSGEIAASREVLERRTEEALAGLTRQIEAGEVLAARARLERWRGTPHRRIRTALEGWASPRGWPYPGSSPVSGGEDLPAPRPLPARRRVRWYEDGGIHRARVVQSRADGVTLEIRSAGGITYPTARRTGLEPIDASADERLAQCLAAVGAGDGVLARLWLASARAAGAGGSIVESLTALLSADAGGSLRETR